MPDSCLEAFVCLEFHPRLCNMKYLVLALLPVALALQATAESGGQDWSNRRVAVREQR